MKLNGCTKHMISNICGNIHVGSTNMEVLRELRNRIVSNNLAGKVSRELRKAVYRYALRCHRRNYLEYMDVMFPNRGYRNEAIPERA